MSLLDRLKRALGLSAEEDPLRREIEEMRRLARAATRLALVERRKPRKKSLELELFPEELVQK